MHTQTPTRLRFLRGISATMIVLATSLPRGAAAQQPQAFLELRPHCENEEMTSQFGGPVPQIDGVMTLTDGRCASFTAADPQNLQTAPMKKDDILDVDLVVRNTNGNAVRSVQTWIAYDPTVLEGVDMTLHPSFPIPTPGENIFSAKQGYIIIGATAAQEESKQTAVVVRIRLKVIATNIPSTVLSFVSDERTAALRRNNAEDVNILTALQPSLIVRLNPNGSSSSAASIGNTDAPVVSTTGSNASAASSASSAAVSTASSSASSMPSSVSASSVSAASVSSAATPPSAPGIFTMLQVQNLRVTTQGTTVYAAWDPLGSAELAGYALYYSSVSGRYIHRRSVPLLDASIIIRSLPEGSTQYFAVRGVTADGRETEFSQEVAVTVGDATTSTSLLTANSISPPSPRNDGTVAGSAGSSTALVLLVLLSAAIGTAFAFRRQLIASTAK